MTTPPNRPPPQEPARKPTQDNRPARPPAANTGQPRAATPPHPASHQPAAGSGLAAPRPQGEGAPRAVPAEVAARALLAESAVAGAGAEGQAAGRATSEISTVGAAAAGPAVGESRSAVLGQWIGSAQGEGLSGARGQGQGHGQGQVQGHGQGQGQVRGEVRAQAAGVAVAAPVQGIGRRDREPNSEPEPHTASPLATRPMPSRHIVSLFGLRAGQLVTWELAVLGVALVYRKSLAVLIPVAVVALALILVSVVRRRSQYLYQWLGLWLRYRFRHRQARLGGGEDEAGPDDVAAALLSRVVRGGDIVAVEIDEVAAAFISHAGGLTAVLEVTPLEAEHVVEPSQLLPPLPALLPTAEFGEPLISAQIIIQSIPAPNFLGLADSAAISYRELAGGVVPATRGCWLALQAEHIAEQYSAAELHESLVRAVQRVQRRVRKSGLRARLLNHDELVTELLSLARVDARQASMTPAARRSRKVSTPAVQECWRTWSAGPQVHTTFRLLGWPDLADAAGQELLDRLVHTPTLATTVTVAARRRLPADILELEAAIRVTLPDAGAVDPATKEIRAIVEAVGGRVERLDGEQVFGVAATLPLGGFLS